MNPLHRGDNAQAREARDVVGVQMLGVLDAPTQFAAIDAGILERPLIDVEHFAVGTISDGMCVELKTVLDRNRGRLLDDLHRSRLETRGLGHVCVRLQHPGAVRPERTVDGVLESAH